MSSTMKILVTNDDGIDAPGLVAACEALAGKGELYVVAPAEPQSAVGHAVTFHREIEVKPNMSVGGIGATSVRGRPADCAKLGVNYIHADVDFDLVVSGINAGANVGVNTTYSGTVGAAREGAIMGLPAIALSLHLGDRTKTDWAAAAVQARRALEVVMAGPLERGRVTNVNIPILDDGAEPVGIRVGGLSTVPISDRYRVRVGADGQKHYEAKSSMSFRGAHESGSDVDLLFKRYVTVTPIALDTTCRDGERRWRDHVEGSGVSYA